jgi:hypothetical protein
LWIWEELWDVELDGEITERGHKLSAERGRLVRRVDAWSVPMAQTFARESAARAAGHAAGVLRDAGYPEASETFASGAEPETIRAVATDLFGDLPPDVRRSVGMAADGSRRAIAAASTTDPYIAAQGGAVAAYIAAMTALRVGGRPAYDAERVHQADWMARALDLA